MLLFSSPMTFGDILFFFFFDNEIGFVTYNALPKVLWRKISLPKGPTIFKKKLLATKPFRWLIFSSLNIWFSDEIVLLSNVFYFYFIKSYLAMNYFIAKAIFYLFKFYPYLATKYFVVKTNFLILPYLATKYFITKCYYSIISKLLVTKISKYL